MLLRRMMEHVNARNWTAVVLDFVIVVQIFAEKNYKAQHMFCQRSAPKHQQR